MTEQHLAGRRAVVTGGAGGIGELVGMRWVTWSEPGAPHDRFINLYASPLWGGAGNLAGVVLVLHDNTSLLELLELNVGQQSIGVIRAATAAAGKRNRRRPLRARFFRNVARATIIAASRS